MQTTGIDTYQMTIGGELMAAERTFGVINPATGRVFERAPECSEQQLDAAMSAAERTFSTWRRDVTARREALQDCAAALRSAVDDLAPVLTREQGKPLARSVWEIKAAAKSFARTAELEIPVEVVIDNDRVRVEVHRRPIGVVAAITPWNFPVSLAAWKIAPALLAGNTVVLKPSPFTPLATLRVGEILRSVLPPGVLNVVSGGDELGASMTTHPAVRKISFTGSVATGKLVAAAAAPDLKRVTLELGGNDPAIVLPDLAPTDVASKLFWGAFENCGQVCSAIKRVYVPAGQYEQYLEALGSVAASAVVGDGMDEATQIGPLNNAPQLDRVGELVDDAKRHGARVIQGGTAIGDSGYFYAPTVIGDVTDGIRLVDEEQFGPVLPVVPYDDVDDAIARANATHFGLSGSVWSGDTDRARDVASRLECGTAWVNQHLSILPGAPFGGVKWSGIGVENGPWGLLGFTEIQTVNIAKT